MLAELLLVDLVLTAQVGGAKDMQFIFVLEILNAEGRADVLAGFQRHFDEQQKSVYTSERGGGGFMFWNSSSGNDEKSSKSHLHAV